MSFTAARLTTTTTGINTDTVQNRTSWTDRRRFRSIAQPAVRSALSTYFYRMMVGYHGKMEQALWRGTSNLGVYAHPELCDLARRLLLFYTVNTRVPCMFSFHHIEITENRPNHVCSNSFNIRVLHFRSHCILQYGILVASIASFN
jgi:hypothetical protein